MSDAPAAPRWKGPLAFMAQNSVAANLLMLMLVVGGLMTLGRVKQEVFPQFELDIVLVSVAYPGASPAEVEQGVILATEEAVREVDGVKEVTSTAAESSGFVIVELISGTNASRALADIKSAIDRVQSFPKEIERPIVSLAALKKEVISLVLYGDEDERSLRRLGEEARDALLAQPGITSVDLAGVRPLEISAEVPSERLRRYGLTLEQVAGAIRQASVEVPGGGVKTPSGEVLVRTAERRSTGAELAGIVVLSQPDGTEIRLGEIADVQDGFAETDQEALFNGKRAVMVKVFRVGDQTPVGVSDAVHAFAETHRQTLPPGVKLAVWADWSEFYRDRVDLLMRNAYLGLVLVILVLSLFLEIRLAFWVTLGIPISFIGSLLFMPTLDASINMISLFAFIVVLGMVVDDAIVVGEAVYTRRTQGESALDAAIGGVREVALPVSFAILTTIIAFSPMLFVPGPAGKFFRLIPVVVIAVLLISWVESLAVLPAHLAHSKPGSGGRFFRFVHHQQQRAARGIEWLIQRTYVPTLRAALSQRYLTLAVCAALFLATLGLIAGGRVNFTFLPKVEGDVVVVDIRMPFGVPVEKTRALLGRLTETAREVMERSGGEDALSRGIFAQIGATGSFDGGDRPQSRASGSHVAEAAVFLVPADQRAISTSEFVRRWRARLDDVIGVESMKFRYDSGPSGGAPVQIELSHHDLGVLEEAAERLAADLRGYEGLFDIDDGFSPGKEQLDFKLTPAARALALTEVDLGRQVRASFYGAEAVRQQRGRDEIRVVARLPESERRSEYDVEKLLLRTPAGGEIPLGQAAEVSRGRAYTQIKRRAARRVVAVGADIDPAVANATDVVSDVEARILPGLVERYPGLTYSLEGEQRQQREVLDSLRSGFAMALAAIFALLAVAFRSYVQPLIVMAVIPFGLIGAVVGHVMLGYDLSLMSLMGVVALSGVVVNDSLILIVAINRFRENGMGTTESIEAGGARRFRPIVLTSLTTFFGLVPMILERSFQARFLIPMALSLGFGVLFATFITLVMVPALSGVVDDAKAFWERAQRGTPKNTDGTDEPGVRV